jgi:TatD DNase family protein
MLVDSHCHLDDAQFEPDRAATVARALEAGVGHMLAVGTGNGPPDLEAGLRLAEAFACMTATVGVHPHDASKASTDTWDRMRELLGRPKAVAVGEIGLDYHYDLSPRPVQREAFTRQLEIAAGAAKPVIIHTREAWEDTLAILREGWKGACVIHCFTGDERQAEEALEAGYYLAFGGMITFPKAGSIREAARMTPLDRLLVETDAPYLAPVPYRGKRNEPARVAEVARHLAALRGCGMEEVAQAATANFERLGLRGGIGNGYTG